MRRFLAARLPKDKLPAEVGDVAGSLRMVARIAERTPSGSFARTLLYNNAGTTRLAAGDTEGARAWFQQAYDVPQPGKRPIELWAVLSGHPYVARRLIGLDLQESQATAVR